jgi:hypothetical protein
MSTLNTTGWKEFPFTAQGHQFVSKLAPNSPFLARVAMLPAGVFEEMNRDAISQLVGVGFTREQIVEKLVEINEHASHAVVEIV